MGPVIVPVETVCCTWAEISDHGVISTFREFSKDGLSALGLALSDLSFAPFGFVYFPTSDL
jgi:hypothetical protein